MSVGRDHIDVRDDEIERLRKALERIAMMGESGHTHQSPVPHPDDCPVCHAKSVLGDS